MFCSKCGAPIPEGAKFCQTCGTPAETSSGFDSAPSAGTPQSEPYGSEAPDNGFRPNPPLQGNADYNNQTGYYNAPAGYGQGDSFPASPKKINKKLIAILASCVVAVTIAVILIVVLVKNSSPYSSPEGVSEKFLDLAFSGDIPGCFDYYVADLWEYAKEEAPDYFEDIEEFCDEKEEKIKETINDKWGGDYSYSYKSKKEIDTDDAEDLIATLKKRCGRDYVRQGDVEAACKVTFRFLTEYDDVEISLYVVKIGGDWYVYEFPNI